MPIKDTRFDGFDWDEGNSRHSAQEPRFLAAGRTGEGRWMLLSFTIRVKSGKTFIRPISARYMHAKEITRYEQADQEKG